MEPIEPPDTVVFRPLAHRYFGRNASGHHKNKEDFVKNLPGISYPVEISPAYQIKSAPQCEQCFQKTWSPYQYPHQYHSQHESLALGQKSLFPVTLSRTFQCSYLQYCKHTTTIDLTKGEKS